MTDPREWLIRIAQSGRALTFDATALPVTCGAQHGADIRLPGVRGTIQFGALESVFFVQVGKDTFNVRVNGTPLSGSRRLIDGDEIAFDTARLRCRIAAGRLSVDIDTVSTAGDTAPPDFEDLARAPGVDEDVAITPIAFKVDGSKPLSPRGLGLSKTAIGVLSAFVGLAILGWFAFTGKSVEFVSEPQIADLDLPETLFKVRIGDRYLLRPGSHRVTGQVDGYVPLDSVVEVGSSADQTIELALEKLPGLITVTSVPQTGVAVSLDGQPLGRTPLNDIEVPAGSHSFEFVLPRHFSETVSIDVTGMSVRQAVSATMQPNWAPVQIDSVPRGAEVLIDGQAVGAAPLQIELDQGLHDLELRLRGFNAWRNEIEVFAGEPMEIPPVAMVEADGRIRLTSEPSSAAVNVNGEYEGQTPLELRLRPGRSHRIVLTKPGYETVSTELSVAADSGRTVQLELPGLFGDVEIVSEPPNAQVWIDDELAGSTPAQLNLLALPHSVEVRLDGYAVARADITPRPGRLHTLPFELEKLDDTTGGGYPSVVRTSLDQELRLVPAGDFTMGTSRRETGRRSNEFLRPVSLSKAFYLAVNEVTNAEFRAFRAEHDSGTFSGESLNGDSQPVVEVSWTDVVQFLNWLSIKDGFQPVYEEGVGGWAAVRPLRNGYRLPTEAEWAWAARFAGHVEPLVYPWGQEIPPPDRSGNYADIAASRLLPTTLVTYNDGFGVTAPVGSFDGNDIGIFDLGGNVAEWVQDVYTLDITGSSDVVVDPLGPVSGEYHIVRGSSWRSATVTDLRVAYRNYGSDGRDDVGFRIARNLE